MSQDNCYQNDEYEEAWEAMERIFNEPSEETFLEDMLVLGRAITSEMEERERNTVAKAVHFRGIKAAQDFEKFVKEHFPVKHFDRFYSDVSETLCYDVALPKLLHGNSVSRDIVKQFDRILKEAAEIEFSEAEDQPDMRGWVYLYISFSAVVRVFKE